MTLFAATNFCRHISKTVLRNRPDHLCRNVFPSTTHRLMSEDSTSRASPAQASCMTDIGIREIFNSDHDILRTSVRKFFDEEIKPHHDQWERDGYMPKEFFEKAGEAGLLCCMIPEEYGGPGGDILDQVIVLEEQSYSNCSGPGFGAHSLLPAPYILRFGSEEQKLRYLPDMVTGKSVGCLAMTEPAAGSDLQGMKSRAVKDGDDWILNGSKIFISNGIISDVAIVAAITDPEAKSKAHGMGLFIVDCNSEGFKRGRNLRKLGKKAQERLGASIGYQASAEFMFEETRSYIKERKAFGKPISKLQVIRHKMADLKIQICAARAFTDHCIMLYKDGTLTSSTASMAKALATDLANKVAYDGLQLHGGYGYMEEYPICRAYRDVRVGPIYAGTNEIMKELISRDIVS